MAYQLLIDDTHKDIQFLISDNTIEAHSFIIRDKCEKLYQLFIFNTTAVIDDISFDVFNQLLYFFYTDCIPLLKRFISIGRKV
jgi:hypothetical protein